MNRSLIIVLGSLALCAALCAGSYVVSQRVSRSAMVQPKDDLDWLRQEFHLADAEMARVRKLHEGYMPKCAAMCRQIAAKKQELESALTGATNVTASVEQRVAELCELRAKCQLQMLRHFVEVSQAMPLEQGRIYLVEMQRLTLGFHEQVEQSMSHSTVHKHGHP